MTEKKDILDFHVTFESSKRSNLTFRIKNAMINEVKDVIAFAEKISSEHYSCIRITKDITTLQQHIGSNSLKYEDLKKQVERKKKAKYTWQLQKSLKMKLYNLYEQYLGFEIKPIKGGPKENQYEVLFSFKNIRKTNPDKHHFLVLVLKDKVYKVSECVPSIKGLDEMFKELNKTDDLSSFVIELRRKFCAISGSREPMNDCTNNP